MLVRMTREEVMGTLGSSNDMLRPVLAYLDLDMPKIGTWEELKEAIENEPKEKFGTATITDSYLEVEVYEGFYLDCLSMYSKHVSKALKIVIPFIDAIKSFFTSFNDELDKDMKELANKWETTDEERLTDEQKEKFDTYMAAYKKYIGEEKIAKGIDFESEYTLSLEDAIRNMEKHQAALLLGKLRDFNKEPMKFKEFDSKDFSVIYW